MPPPVLGIDFGTTNTVVAVVLEEDNVEVLCNDIGSRLTPSVVYIDPSDPTKHQVGEAALRLGVGDPQNTIRNVKRILGYPPETARFVKDLGPVKFGTSGYGDGVLLNLNDGSKITPEEVVAMQLVEVRKAAKRNLNLDQEVLEAVITVPCYYTAAQRRAIRDAAYLADLQVVSLVNETTAAAAVYAHERQDSKTALIVDVGGGGCCISVVRVAADEVTVLACSTRQPGGVTFDNQMLNYLKKAIKEQHGKDVNDHRTNEILHSQWTAAKIKLSRVPHAIIQTFLPEIEAEFSMTLTRTVFEKECEELFKTIVKSIHRTLKKAEVEVNLLEDVVLVGGCTRIPKLRELIQDAIGLKVHKALSADEVVAQGAALLGARIVKINQEVLGLNTNFQVLSSEKQDYPETVWSIGTRLPLTISFDCLKEKDNTDIMVKQGHDMKHLIFVCELPVCKFQNFRIDLEGCFLFGTGSPNKVFASKYLKGCIPQAYLKTLKQKLQSQEKSSLLFAQAKNALEDVLRKGRSMVTNEEDLFPEEHLKFREECCKKLKWLNENASAAIETFEKTRDMMEQLRESLHEKCERERQRIRERTALKDILDKAVDMEVFDDEFKERTRELKDDWGKEKEWLAKNSEASVNEYLTKKECVLQAMKILKDDRDKAAIIKRTNALRESFLKKITELQTYADRRSNGDDLDRKCGNNLTQIWNSAIMWLKSNPTPSEVELEQKIEKFEKDRISTEETFEKLKKQEQIKREDAFKTAERHILKGLNLKVSDFEIVHEAALMFVKTCDKDLIWLRNNPDRNATEYSELTTKVEIDFRNLQNLHEVEKRRLQTKARFKQSLQNALKQTEEPFSIFFKNCLVWLEDHPRAEEKLLKTSLSLVESALDELKKYSYHTNTARTAKGLALEKTESLSQKLGLQFNDSAATAEIRREDNGYKPAEYEEQSPSTLGDRNGLINHANGSPSVAIHYHPTLTERAEQLAVEALSGADKAGSMALLLSKVIFGGREFVSLAVRYVEESGQPVERPLLLKEPMGFGEDTESVKELFVEPFLALCKKAQIDWNKNLLGISHVGLGVQSEVLAKFLAGMRCGLVEDLDCGAVRLDERFVQKILRQAGCCRLESPLHSLRDFFLSIGSLRRLFCTGGKWCKVLEDKCCSPCAGTNPWHTYTSTISFVSVEQKGLYLALTAVAQKDPDLRIHVEAIQGKMEDSSFKICLETCKEFFKLIPGFDDKLALSNSNSITDLNKSLLKAFKYPEGSLEPFFNLPLYSDKLRANKLFEMCEDLMKPVLEEWKKSWDVLLSLLTAICDVLPEGNGKETPARCTRSQGKLAKDLQNFKSQFPERLTSLPAMLCGLPRKMFAKEYPDLHNSLMRALTAPLLPPQGPRAQEQLRACALHAITSPRLIDWPLPAETHP